MWTVLGLDRDSSAWRRLSTPPPAAPAALNQAGPVSPSLSLPDQPGNPKLLSQRLRLQTGLDSSQQDYWTAFFVFFAGLPAKTEVVDNKDGTHTVTYVPLTSGMYTLLLKYGGQPVPGFPAKVMVDPAVDTSKVKVFGPGLEGPGEGPPERPHRRDTNPRVQPQLALSLLLCSRLPRGHHGLHGGRSSSVPERRGPREGGGPEPIRGKDGLLHHGQL